jgi:two-component system, NarL family, nitrate/nitrite response regulator NarL
MERTPALLIDPNKLFREGLKRLLDDSPFEIVAEASNLREGAAIVETGLQTDLVLLDLVNGGDDEAEAMRRLRRLLPEARIVVLTTELCTRRLTNALGAGADGYLMKDLSSAALAQSLRLVIMGEKVFPTHLAALLISGRVNGNGLEMPISRKGLSPREVQILRCLLNGDSNKMIANHLHITEATVKVHLKSLLRKINASNRTQAAIWALNNGLDGRTPGDNAGAEIAEDLIVAAE